MQESDELNLNPGGVAFRIKEEKISSFTICLIFQEASENDSLCEPALDESISFNRKLSFLRWLMNSTLAGTAISWRLQASLLYSLCGTVCKGSPRDPAVAAWLLDPGESASTLNRMILDRVPELCTLLHLLGSAPGVGSVSCRTVSQQPGRIRAIAESVLVRRLQQVYSGELRSSDLLEHYLKVEMEVERVLLGMELTGMTVNQDEFRDTSLLLNYKCKAVEEEAFKLAGRHFVFSSPQDICRVLYHELKLPINGDPKLRLNQVRRGRGGIRLSAAKESLEKLAKSHQLPKLILEHRRLSGAMSRTVTPLLAAAVTQPHQSNPRVYPRCLTHTATGRVSLQEPNLQNIPRDFEVDITEELRNAALGPRATRRRSRRSSSGGDQALPQTVSLRYCDTNLNVYISITYQRLNLRSW